MKTHSLSLLTLSALLLGAADMAFAQGTAFTYKGQLSINGSPANGSYDLTFSLFDTESETNQVRSTVTSTGVVVSNGLFTSLLDFGAGVFTGADRWLEIGVRTNGGGAFTTLSPRQQLTPTPYAITAGNLSGTLLATQLSGTLPSAQLGGTYGGAVTFDNASNSFAGSGAGLTAVNAATVGGLGASRFWQLGGNAGTTAGVNFLGTTDDQALELRVNGQRAFRLEPTTGTPNVIAGFSGNFHYTNAVGITISGGGASDAPNVVLASGNNSSLFATISGGSGNAVARSDYGTIAGGSGNGVGLDGGGQRAPFSAIGGGSSNLVTGAAYSLIAGGLDNSIYGGVRGSDYSAIGGGTANKIGEGSRYGTIGGGQGNRVQAGGNTSWGTIGGGLQNSIYGKFGAIGGGAGNLISGDCDGGPCSIYSTIAGGWSNLIFSSSATIAGGSGNFIPRGDYGTIAGGSGNLIGMDLQGPYFSGFSAPYATIAGGADNNIFGALAPVYFSTIGGGQSNVVTASYATVSGGSSNLAAGVGAFIGGGGTDGTYSAGNLALGAASMVGGGVGNAANSRWSTISGGSGNAVASSDYGTIAGGSGNSVGRDGGGQGAPYSTIGGGSGNRIIHSLYTVIAGGLSNSIYGGGAGCDYSTIGGGNANYIDLGSGRSTIGGGEGNRVIAHAGGHSWATIGGGLSNIISGIFGTIGGGVGNFIYGEPDVGPPDPYNTIGGGSANTIDFQWSGATIAGGTDNRVVRLGSSYPRVYGSIGGGQSNVVAGDYATVPGGTQAKASQYGQLAYASGQFATNGDAQTSVLVCRGTTTDATPTELFLNGVSQRMMMPTNSSWTFDILIAGRAANGDSAAYQILGAAANNAGISGFPATPQKNVIAANVAAWDVNMFAPGTNGTIIIRVTGQDATSIRWVASVRTVEVTY